MMTRSTWSFLSVCFGLFLLVLPGCGAGAPEPTPSEPAATAGQPAGVSPAADRSAAAPELLRCPTGQTLCTCHCVDGDVSMCFKSGLAGSEQCKEFCFEQCR